MRFQTKLLIVFMVSFVAATAIMLALSMRSERGLVDTMEGDLQSVVHSVQSSTQELSLEQSPDNDALVKFIENARRNPAIREVSVVGSTQEVVASSNPRKVGKKQPLVDRVMVVREQLGANDARSEHIRYSVKVPIFRGSKLIGLLETSIIVNDLRALLRAMYLKNILVALAAFVAAFGVSWAVIARLNRPLRRLHEAAGRIAAGDLTVRIERPGHDEVGKVTAAFNAMADTLQDQKVLEDRLRSMERKAILSETAATFAHEIRNPLNLINLTADHIVHQYRPGDEKERKTFDELADNLKKQVRHVNAMVNDYLSIGKPVRLRRRGFAAREFIHEVAALVRPQMAEKGIEMALAVPGSARIIADREQFQLVLMNLLINAVEALPQGGRIEVSLDVNVPGPILLRVADNGPGVPPEDLERIFEPYFSKRSGGTGLGLSLSRRIVEEHGGCIRATNVPAGGACFEIEIPLLEADNGKNSVS